MPKKRLRVFSRAFKLAAVRRMMAGEDVSALSRELRVLRKALFMAVRDLTEVAKQDRLRFRLIVAIIDHALHLGAKGIELRIIQHA